MKPSLRAQKTQLLLCMLGLALACGRANAAPAAPPTADTLLQAPAAPPVDGDDIRNVGKVTGAALEAVQKARGFIAKLKEAGRFLERITGGDLIALPAGVQKQIGNVVYTMGVSAVRLKPTHTEVDIFLEIDLPEQEEDLVFGAEGIAFSREGGFVGHVELALLGGYGVDLREGKSRIVFEPRTAQGGTYAVVGCDGFKELNVEGYVLFSRDWLIPAGAAAVPAAGGQPTRIRGDFSFNAQSWDFVVSLTDFDPFLIQGVEDVVWEVGGITLDFSEVENAPDVRFPTDYVSPFTTPGGMSEQWRGVYIEGVRVKLPERFSRPGAPPIGIDAERIIIDDQGFTGKVDVYNILALNEGNADGWAFSVDSFRIDIMAMQLREGRMAGLIHVPLLSRSQGATAGVEPQDCLGYTAVISPGSQYSFTARPGSDYRANVWKAEVVIEPNSTVSLHYAEGVLTAGAELFGAISVRDDFGGSIGVEMDGISFEGLALSTRSPYIEPGLWGFPAQIGARMGSFMLNFEEIRLEKGDSPEEIHLKFIAALELSAGGGADIYAEGGFRIEGALEAQDGRSKWTYKRFKVESIYVEASTSAWGLAGALNFYERHPVYGNGFKGMVGVWFAGVSTEEGKHNPGSSGIAAVGQFGSVAPAGGGAEFRYFFVDVMAGWENGLPVGGLRLMAIGGGVYNRMAPQSSGVNLAMAPAPVSELGASLSGIVYLPDASRGIRIKATLVVASPSSDEAFSVNGTFEIVMNSSGGLDTVRIYGNVSMFGPIVWDATAPPANTSGVVIFIDMVYDNVGEERGFSATADVFINLASGKVRGNARPNSSYAGHIDLKFSNQTWYVNIGTPSCPIGVEADFGVIRPSLSAYLDLGNNIPPMPPLPDYVTRLTGGSSNFMRNESLYATGAGFAFGVAASMAPGRKRLPPFYYELSFGLGFDIMLQNYGEAQCANTGGDRIGINGWYASGQAWAFLQGALGIRVNLAFVQGEFEILQAAIAAVLQAKGPNPFWGGARVAGNYRILGGLVKGSFRMNVEVGEACVMTGDGGDPMANMNLIMNTQPYENQSGFPVDAHPLALMNLPLNEPMTFDDDEYKIVIVEAMLRRGTQVLPSQVMAEPGDNLLTLVPADMLPANMRLLMRVKVALMRKSGESFSDTVKIETREVSFRTGPSLDHIPLTNIAHSYPLVGQRNLFVQESNQGHIQLKQGQSNLFLGSVHARFTSTSGTVMSAPVQYLSNLDKLVFTFPELAPGTAYRFEVYKPAGNQPGDQEGVGSDGPMPYEERYYAQEEHVLLTYYFRTSQYPNFAAKINAIPQLTLNREGNGVFSCDGEFFDLYELSDHDYGEGLIKLSVNLNSNTWYQSQGIQSLLYNNLPIPGMVENTWRDVSEPIGKAVYLLQTLPHLTDESVFESGVDGSYEDTLSLKIPDIIQQDYQGYKRQVDSLVGAWALEAIERYLIMEEEFGFSQQYDANRDGVVTYWDMIYLISNYCDISDACNSPFQGLRCPWLLGDFQCPIPAAIAGLHGHDPSLLNTINGATFDVLFSYTLPGAVTPNSTATVRVVMNP